MWLIVQERSDFGVENPKLIKIAQFCLCRVSNNDINNYKQSFLLMQYRLIPVERERGYFKVEEKSKRDYFSVVSACMDVSRVPYVLDF